MFFSLTIIFNCIKHQKIQKTFYVKKKMNFIELTKVGCIRVRNVKQNESSTIAICLVLDMYVN
jgi:hypothetical protein